MRKPTSDFDLLAHVVFACAHYTVIDDCGTTSSALFSEWMAECPSLRPWFIETYRKMMHDESMSFVEKIFHYVDLDYLREEDARQHLENIWRDATGEVWSWESN